MRIVGTTLPEDAWLNPVAVATTGSNIALSGQKVVDGVTVGQFAAGDPRVQRVLVKDQSDATTNGVYNACQTAWTRALDANDNTQWAQGVQVIVNGGTTYAGAVFRCTSAGTNGQILVGRTVLTFAQFAVSNLAPPVVKFLTAAGPYAALPTDEVLIVKQVVGAPFTVTVDWSLRTRGLRVVDGRGDASVNNITITPAPGQTQLASFNYSYVIDGNGGSITLTPLPDNTGAY